MATNRNTVQELMTHNLTKQLTEQLQHLGTKTPDQNAVHQVKRCTLDYLGATFAGAEMLKQRTVHLKSSLGQNPKGVGVIGVDFKASLETAALINGMNSHIAEMDDGVRFGMIHPGAPIYSALFPVAEHFKVSRESFTRGVLVGYDAALRLASALQPTHYQRGYHPTATCGCLGATAGVAAMLGFTAQEMEAALAAAAVSAAGSLKVVDRGSELKPYNVGRAAVVAIHSALIAQAGFAAPPDALSGKSGFLEMTSDRFEEKLILSGAPADYWIHSVYVKPYAACRHAHPSIEAVTRILQKYPGETPNIEAIDITTYHGLEGRHDHQKVTDISAAKMSIPFSVALAIQTGGAGIEEFTQSNIENDLIRTLAEKVNITADHVFTARVPEQRGARVTITTSTGQVFQEEITYPKGEPENPITDQELSRKFYDLARYGGVEQAKIDALDKFIWDFSAPLESLFPLLKTTPA